MTTKTESQDEAAAVGDALPERDQAKPAEQQGVFRKFVVRRVDGSDEPGGKHHGCEYFVLDTDHDPHAKAALAAYAQSCQVTHPDLSRDMVERYKLTLPDTESIQQEYYKRGWKESQEHYQASPAQGGVGEVERIKHLRRALTMYADPSEWYKEKVASPWHLQFNSRDWDGNGWDIAAKALREDNAAMHTTDAPDMGEQPLHGQELDNMLLRRCKNEYAQHDVRDLINEIRRLRATKRKSSNQHPTTPPTPFGKLDAPASGTMTITSSSAGAQGDMEHVARNICKTFGRDPDEVCSDGNDRTWPLWDEVRYTIEGLITPSPNAAPSPLIWQDISTAPKDESLFLLRHKRKWTVVEAALFWEPAESEGPHIFAPAHWSLHDMTVDLPIEDDYEDYEWMPTPPGNP